MSRIWVNAFKQTIFFQVWLPSFLSTEAKLNFDVVHLQLFLNTGAKLSSPGQKICHWRGFFVAFLSCCWRVDEVTDWRVAVHLDGEQQGGCGRARDVGPNRNKKWKRVDTNVCPFVCLYVYVFVLACWCEFVLHNGFCVPILSIFKLFESAVVKQLNWGLLLKVFIKNVLRIYLWLDVSNIVLNRRPLDFSSKLPIRLVIIYTFCCSIVL